jgi:hypothetical protein
VSLSSRFPLDTAADRLREHFTNLELIDLGGVIDVPEPGPIVAHWPPTGPGQTRWACRSRQFSTGARRLTEHLDRHGTFTITSQVGMVVGQRRR